MSTSAHASKISNTCASICTCCISIPFFVFLFVLFFLTFLTFLLFFHIFSDFLTFFITNFLQLFILSYIILSHSHAHQIFCILPFLTLKPCATLLSSRQKENSESSELFYCIYIYPFILKAIRKTFHLQFR